MIIREVGCCCILVDIPFFVPFADQSEIVQLFLRITVQRVSRIVGLDEEMAVDPWNPPKLIVMHLRNEIEVIAEIAKRDDIRFVLLDLGQERLNVLDFLDGCRIQPVLVGKSLLHDIPVTIAVDLLVRNAVDFPVDGQAIPHDLRDIRFQFGSVLV
ncbi:hypothetical protein D3C74_368580 [compost metagenome]